MVAGFQVTPSTLTVSEGSTATLSVVLLSEPTGLVGVFATSANTNEVTVSNVLMSPIFFDSSDWSTPQTVTVTGVNDNTSDASTSTIVTFEAQSEDGDYNGMQRTVTVTNTDIGVAGITLSETALAVSESNTTATFDVSLAAQPIDTVVLVITSADNTQVTVSPPTLTFETNNWNTLQTVTVTGVGDALANGTIDTFVTISISAGDGGAYDGVSDRTVTVASIEAPMITPSVSVAAPVALTVGVAMTPITISNSGGASTTYSVTPALPAGLSLNTTTGTISGTPLGTRSTTTTTHTVTATNDGGSSSFVISFAITSTTVCFVDPTTAMVRLADGGTRSVDVLQPGDRVAVLGVGAAPARVVGVHRTQHAGRVIMIGANMLGYRHSELRLTEGHLVAQWLANRRIRLMPAGALPTSQQTRTTTVAHVSLDRNDLLCVNGVWVESADTTGATATARIAKLYATLAQRNVACHHR